MIWRILAECLFVGLLLFLGSGFWALVKSKGHLKAFLSNPEEVNRLFSFLGNDTVREKAARIQPVAGSYAANIATWEAAHLVSLSGTRNLLGMVALAVLAVSGWLGIWYLLVSGAVFLLPAFFDLPASAKNNNVIHVQTIIVNLAKWYSTDQLGCRTYCEQTHPEYRHLYESIERAF